MIVESKTLGSRSFDIFNYVLLGLLAFVCFYPMMHVLWGSFSDPVQFAVHTGALLWPQGFSTAGYKIVFKNPNIWTGYGNTLFYVVIGTIIKLFMTSLGAYVLSRKGFMFRRFLTLMVVFTMYFGGGLIPNFLLVQKLGIYNSRLAIILPALIATWNLIILKTAFQTVPASLRESAELDGANDLIILMRIIIPVSKATIAVIAMYYAVGEWNAWFNAMVYLRDRSKYPLQLFLREILLANSDSGNLAGEIMEEGSIELFIEEIIRYCTIVVSTLPILCAYPFIQKYFVRGVMMGSLKE
jgi:putative aldouronate transport system permease protein